MTVVLVVVDMVVLVVVGRVVDIMFAVAVTLIVLAETTAINEINIAADNSPRKPDLVPNATTSLPMSFTS